MKQGDLITLVLWMAVLFGAMYFMIILPQKRRDKKTREMLGALQVGSEVVTVGGVMGKIVNIKDDEITVETSVEKTKISFNKWAIKEVKKPIEA